MLARDVSMNVPNIGQGLGSVTTFPPTLAGSESAAPVADAVGTGPASTAAASPNVSPTRLAWFDVNGDGRIDPRSADAGGDATLLVPARAIALSTYGRQVSPPAGTHANPTKAPGNEVPTVHPAPSNAAQTNRAVDAYQRYGQAPTDGAELVTIPG
jgi:hypothetical protein